MLLKKIKILSFEKYINKSCPSNLKKKFKKADFIFNSKARLFSTNQNKDFLNKNNKTTEYNKAINKKIYKYIKNLDSDLDPTTKKIYNLLKKNEKNLSFENINLSNTQSMGIFKKDIFLKFVNINFCIKNLINLPNNEHCGDSLEGIKDNSVYSENLAYSSFEDSLAPGSSGFDKPKDGLFKDNSEDTYYYEEDYEKFVRNLEKIDLSCNENYKEFVEYVNTNNIDVEKESFYFEELNYNFSDYEQELEEFLRIKSNKNTIRGNFADKVEDAHFDNREQHNENFEDKLLTKDDYERLHPYDEFPEIDLKENSQEHLNHLNESYEKIHYAKSNQEVFLLFKKLKKGRLILKNIKEKNDSNLYLFDEFEENVLEDKSQDYLNVLSEFYQKIYYAKTNKDVYLTVNKLTKGDLFLKSIKEKNNTKEHTNYVTEAYKTIVSKNKISFFNDLELYLFCKTAIAVYPISDYDYYDYFIFEQKNANSVVDIPELNESLREIFKNNSHNLNLNSTKRIKAKGYRHIDDSIENLRLIRNKNLNKISVDNFFDNNFIKEFEIGSSGLGIKIINKRMGEFTASIGNTEKIKETNLFEFETKKQGFFTSKITEQLEYETFALKNASDCKDIYVIEPEILEYYDNKNFIDITGYSIEKKIPVYQDLENILNIKGRTGLFLPATSSLKNTIIAQIDLFSANIEYSRYLWFNEKNTCLKTNRIDGDLVINKLIDDLHDNLKYTKLFHEKNILFDKIFVGKDKISSLDYTKIKYMYSLNKDNNAFERIAYARLMLKIKTERNDMRWLLQKRMNILNNFGIFDNCIGPKNNNIFKYRVRCTFENITNYTNDLDKILSYYDSYLKTLFFEKKSIGSRNINNFEIFDYNQTLAVYEYLENCESRITNYLFLIYKKISMESQTWPLDKKNNSIVFSFLEIKQWYLVNLKTSSGWYSRHCNEFDKKMLLHKENIKITNKSNNFNNSCREILIEKLSKNKIKLSVQNLEVGLFLEETKYDFNIILNQLVMLLGLWAVLFYLSKILSKKIFDLEKKSAYECGFEPFFILILGIEVSFIVVAFVFLIFDLELVFLLGFIMSVGSIGSFGIIILSIYLLTILGMVYLEMFFGVLSWPIWVQVKKQTNKSNDKKIGVSTFYNKK